MHPRETPKRAQSIDLFEIHEAVFPSKGPVMFYTTLNRRKAQPGLGPGEALQQRVGLFWGLTRRAGVPLATPARVHSIASHALSTQ